MVNSEENMTNLEDANTRVTAGDSRTFYGGKRGDWNSYQRYEEILHHVVLSNMVLLTGLYTILFRATQGLQEGFQMTP